MWPFNTKTKIADSGIFQGFIDCHCHILPGVDDGVETMEESLAILSRYEQLGIKEVWLTPHIMEDVPNTPAALCQRFAELTAAYKGHILLHLSAENMLDSLFLERFETGDLLPWGKEVNHLLVETSYYKAPANFHKLLQNIKSKGYFPILAHPERYLYMPRLEFSSLKQQGIEFQLNLFSLLGMYGKTVKENAEFLLEQGLYDYVATDLHAYEVLESALDGKISKKIIDRVKLINNKF